MTVRLDIPIQLDRAILEERGLLEKYLDAQKWIRLDGYPLVNQSESDQSELTGTVRAMEVPMPDDFQEWQQDLAELSDDGNEADDQSEANATAAHAHWPNRPEEKQPSPVPLAEAAPDSSKRASNQSATAEKKKQWSKPGRGFGGGVKRVQRRRNVDKYCVSYSAPVCLEQILLDENAELVDGGRFVRFGEWLVPTNRKTTVETESTNQDEAKPEVDVDPVRVVGCSGSGALPVLRSVFGFR